MELKRNPTEVLKVLKTIDNKLVTMKHCKVQIPERFVDIGLGQIGVDTFTLGCIAIILDDGSYATMVVTSILELDPYKTIKVDIRGVSYYEFYFEEGDAVIKNLDLIRNDDISYLIFNEFIFQGKIPWYMGYLDICKLFDTAKEYAGSNVGESQETIEFIASIVARSSKDRSKYIRTTISRYNELDGDNVAFVPLMSVLYSVKSTLNKLSGSYFSDGVTSAIVNPSETSSDIERIVRK